MTTRNDVKLELEREETAVLREALEIAVSELGMEIADTDRKAYRDEIKRKRDVLVGILERLRASGRAA